MIFISHSSADAVAAEKLRQQLKQSNFEAIFLDFHAEDGIAAGRNWEQELYRRLKQCYAVVFLCSKKASNSRWCFAELTLARSMGKPIFPVRIEKGAKHPLIGDTQWVDMSVNKESAYDRLKDGLLKLGLDPQKFIGWNPERSPYRGLQAMEEEDAAVFFGRTQETHALFERINNSLLNEGERFIAVIGPSGSGKSSLIRAGLMPLLKRTDPPWLVVAAFAPANDPFEMLARAISKTFNEFSIKRDWRKIYTALKKDPAALVTVARDLFDAGKKGVSNALFVIDQAEELITLNNTETRVAFASLIQQTLKLTNNIRFIATLRSEFLTPLLEETSLSNLMSDPFLLPPIAQAQISAVIVLPAGVAGVEFAPGLVEKIVAATGVGDALPLLAFTLQQLYERIKEKPDRTITDEDYTIVGGVEGSLQRHADGVQKKLIKSGFGPDIIETLLKLTTFNEDAKPTRRRVKMQSFSPAGQEVIRNFIEARLMAADKLENDVYVYVVHEALFRTWAPLAEAISQYKTDLLFRSRLERDAKEWGDTGRSESLLLRGDRLEKAVRLNQVSFFDNRNSLASEFIDASVALKQAELGLKIDFLGERLIKEFNEDPERAILVALAAIDAYGKWPRLNLVLNYAMEAFKALYTGSYEHWLDSIAFSPVEDVIALAGAGKVMLINASDGTQRWQYELPPLESTSLNYISSVSFTASGRYVIVLPRSASFGTVLDTATGERKFDLEIGQEAAGLSCAAKKERVAMGGKNGRLVVWDLNSSQDTVTDLKLEAGISCVAVSPQGDNIVCGCTDYYLYTVQPDKKEATRLNIRHKKSIRQVSFSLKGNRIASVGEEGKINVWTTWSREKDYEVSTYAWEVEWIDNDNAFATTNERYGLRKWNAESGELLGNLVPRSSGSRVASLSHDQTKIATVEKGYTLWIWAITPVRRTLKQRIGNAFAQCAFAGNDQYVVTYSSEYTPKITVREIRTGKEIKSLAVPNNFRTKIKVSDDGQKLAINADNEVIVYSIPDLTELRRVAISESAHVLFAPGEDNSLITVNHDGKVQKWVGRKPVNLLDIGEFYGSSFSVSPDGKYLLYASGLREGYVRLVNLENRTEIFKINLERSGDMHTEMAPDAKSVAIGQGEQLFTVDLSGNVLVRFAWGKYNTGSAYAPAVGRIKFSPDSKRLATCSAEGWVYIWDVQTGELIQLIKAAKQPIGELCFSASGNELLVRTAEFVGEYDSNGYVEAWSCPDFDGLISLAKQKVSRKITPEELAYYGLPGAALTQSAKSLIHLKA